MDKAGILFCCRLIAVSKPAPWWVPSGWDILNVRLPSSSAATSMPTPVRKLTASSAVPSKMHKLPLMDTGRWGPGSAKGRSSASTTFS